MLILVRRRPPNDRYLGRLRVCQAILVHEKLLDGLAIDDRQLLGEDRNLKDVAHEAIASARDGVADDDFREGGNVAGVAIFAIGNAGARGTRQQALSARVQAARQFASWRERARKWSQDEDDDDNDGDDDDNDDDDGCETSIIRLRKTKKT